MDNRDLLVEQKDGVLHLTLNREKRRNALSPSLLSHLREQLIAAEEDPEVRVVCLTGAGEKAFSSGADLMAKLSGEVAPLESSLAYAHLLQQMLRFPKPLVARVNGHAMGGGLGLLLACDIAIAREGTSFGTPEVKVGLFPFMISPLILQHMPRKRATKMMLCGERLNASEALSYGFINECVPADQLDQAVATCLQQLVLAAPVAQRLGKQAMLETANTPFDKAVEILAVHLSTALQSSDAAEGISAFIEKRKPEWKGK